jgi:hypothetical protein
MPCQAYQVGGGDDDQMIPAHSSRMGLLPRPSTRRARGRPGRRRARSRSCAASSSRSSSRCGNVGRAPGVKEELQIPHDSAGRGQQRRSSERSAGLRQIGAQREPLERRQADEAVAQVDDRAAAHDESRSWAAPHRAIDAETCSAAASIGLAASMAKDMPEEKMPHMTASSKAELDVEFLSSAAQLHFFLVAGIGDDGHADQRHQHAGHGEQAAARRNSIAACPCRNGAAPACRPPA